MSDYTKLRTGALERLAAGGDAGAKAELARRSGAPPPKTEAPRERKPRKLIGWQRPIVSSRYDWAPPSCGGETLEFQRQARDYWAAEHARQHAADLATGRTVVGPRREDM